jgi:HK97 family phage major capsid protein
MAKVFELRKERASVAGETRKLIELAVAEQRDNTPEEWSSIEANEKRMAELEKRVAVLDRVEAVEADGERSLGGRHADPPKRGVDPLADTDHEYSLLRAYRCMLGIEKGGLETEVSEEIAKRSNKPAQGLYIPWNLSNRRHREELRERRSLSTTTGAGGIAAILGTELIELLRNRMVLNAMGARVMTDMVGGSFSLPKQTAGSTVYWVAEGNSPTGSNLTIGQVTWTPRTAGAFTDLTRKFVLQTSLDAEMLAREDLARQMAIEMDRVGLNGSGSGVQPLGILQDPGVPTLALGTNGALPTWANVVNLEKLVAQANAEAGKLGYVTSNGGRAIMKQTAKIGSTFPFFLWENDRDGVGELNGRRAFASEQVPSNLTKGSASGICTALIYGNWDSATYAFWGGMDTMVDPYTGSTSGTVRFVMLQDLDFQLRYEQSFAKTVDMLQA